jgi:hypothetical protein
MAELCNPVIHLLLCRALTNSNALLQKPPSHISDTIYCAGTVAQLAQLARSHELQHGTKHVFSLQLLLPKPKPEPGSITSFLLNAATKAAVS